MGVRPGFYSVRLTVGVSRETQKCQASVPDPLRIMWCFWSL
jgi:hypothetical protein